MHVLQNIVQELLTSCILRFHVIHCKSDGAVKSKQCSSWYCASLEKHVFQIKLFALKSLLSNRVSDTRLMLKSNTLSAMRGAGTL